MKLYTFPNNPKAAKALICASINGINIEMPAFQMGVDNQKPEFLSQNPHGKIPLLVTDNGTAVFESNAIARHIARLRPDNSLCGQTFEQTSQVDSWVDYEISLYSAIAPWIYPFLGFMPYNKAAVTEATNNCKKELIKLNNFLKSRTFFVGERMTLADIVLCCALLPAYVKVLSPGHRKPLGNLTRWFTTIVNQPAVKAVLGEVTLCTADPAAPAGAPAAAPAAEKKENKKQEKKEKKKDAPKPKPVSDDPNPAPAKPAGKPKNPLDLLPKSPMVLDEFKRIYSNTDDTKGDVCPQFWKMYDPEGYSLWHCKYKYNEELELSFKVSNLIGGYFNRMCNFHKYGFASFVICGENGKGLTNQGVWLIRGTDMAEEMKICDDTDLYEWKKLDHTNAADRALVEDYWCCEGKSIPDCISYKTFK